jgi:hypothetical protein
MNANYQKNLDEKAAYLAKPLPPEPKAVRLVADELPSVRFKSSWRKETGITLRPKLGSIPDDATEVTPPIINPEKESCRFVNEKWEIISLTSIVKLRRERNIRLKETDHWALSDRTMSDAQKKYRQELRDFPAQFVESPPQLDEFGDLTEIDWPSI